MPETASSVQPNLNAEQHFPEFALVLGIGLLTSLILTPLARRYGLWANVVAVPGDRRKHQGVIARTGGLAMFAAFTLAALVAYALPVERTDPTEVRRLTGLLLGGGLISLIGFWDDRYNLSALWLFLGQLLTAGIAIASLIFIETFNNPLTGNQITWPFVVTVGVSLFWFLLMMNTVNFLDGSDGLAAGVVAIAALMIFIHSAFELNQISVSLLPLALLGATLGFLPYNFHPAKIFMGGGAYFLGYVLGVLSIIGGAKMATILLVMGLPLMDLGWQASSRLLRGRNPLKGDRGHLHFRLIDAGVSPVWIAAGYYTFCTLFGLIALTTSSQLFKLVALSVMVLIVGIVFVWMSIYSPLQDDDAPAKDNV